MCKIVRTSLKLKEIRPISDYFINHHTECYNDRIATQNPLGQTVLIGQQTLWHLELFSEYVPGPMPNWILAANSSRPMPNWILAANSSRPFQFHKHVYCQPWPCVESTLTKLDVKVSQNKLTTELIIPQARRADSKLTVLINFLNKGLNSV